MTFSERLKQIANHVRSIAAELEAETITTTQLIAASDCCYESANELMAMAEKAHGVETKATSVAGYA